MTQSAQETAPARKRVTGLYTIIAIKLGKGLVLIGVALGVYSLMDEDLRAEFERFLRWINLDPEHKFFADLGQKIQRLTPENIRWVAWGTLLYGLLLFVESVGLIFRASWAIWLAIGETGFFIPIEIHELMDGYSLTLLAILAINILIVWYLVRNRQRLFRHQHAFSKASPSE